ncbi:DUF3858 domain-containing protein [Constantimarinum furrinae]|uniref:DUF3857 domain-containing protein n=1 Tax=Constantimarinum furrinae TaxID=2562285 RepID=A0A7G8PRJ8_9FLAO|nr:DUF3857 domain-containing protein [Constantimarinum furrinae]QNJ96964.1 hypothetical protein ALE3EI_0377 [Constantimarinum furrinae]
MKFLLVLTICFFTTLSGNSQNYKFGKVSKEELEEKADPLYPDADASVLYREYKTHFEYTQGEGFTIYTQVFERIKIYNPEGFDWGSVVVKTYNHNKAREEFGSLKGTTYNLVKGSIEKEKLKSNGVFEARLNNYYINNTFTMPNLKPGSVIEYEYKISSPFNDIENIDLQYTIPIRKEVVEVRVPEYYVYNNFSNPQAAVSYNYEKDTKEIEVAIRSRSGLGSANHNSVFDNAPGNSGGMFKYKENIYMLDEENIPPLKKESLVDNLSNYRAKSIWELALIKNPNGIPKSYSTTWEDVTKSIYENDDFVNQIKRKGYFEEDMATAISGLDDPLEKMAAIFHFVKTKVKWNDYLGYFPENGVKKAYSEGLGNSADINLMLVSMLQSANLNANPVLVSTRSNGIPLFPTRYGFNYVIASVEFNNQLYLMDATAPFSGINMLPERAMNWQGRLIRPDGTSQGVGLYPGFPSKEQTYVQAEIVDGVIEAKVRQRKGDHFARAYREKFVNSSIESQMSNLNPDNEAVNISDLEVKDLESLSQNVNLSYSASALAIIEEINGELYLSPMLFFGEKENPFKADTRDYPIFFGYPFSNKYNINIKIPEGYKVTSVPEGIKANLSNNMGSYTYLAKEVGGMIQLSVELEINAPIILSQDYQFLKAMFTQIIEKEKEKVVLTKA